MSDKSEKKKSYIIEKARDVFAKKGFLTVTMKDIVEACQISRGGLYLYFDDTQQLFREVLKMEREKGSDEEIDQADSAVDMLSAFLREQKKEILGLDHSLIVAVYEYYFSLGRSDGGEGESTARNAEHMEKDRFEMAVRVLEKLISAGIREGYLDCDEPLQEAYNIMFALEGLKISSATIGVSTDRVTREINYLFSHLFIKEESFDEEDGPEYDEEDEDAAKDVPDDEKQPGEEEYLEPYDPENDPDNFEGEELDPDGMDSIEQMLVAELDRMTRAEQRDK